jgi:hypothetical protein
MYYATTFNQAGQEGQTPNTGLTKMAVQYSVDTFLVKIPTIANPSYHYATK